MEDLNGFDPMCFSMPRVSQAKAGNLETCRANQASGSGEGAQP